VAGQTVLTGFSPQELTFIIGKHLAMYRGEHYIKTLFPTVTELTVLLFAGMKMVAPETPCRPTSRSRSIATAQTLRGFMQPVQLEGLRMVVKKFIAEGAKANIKRWVQCVEVTAARTGFLLCGRSRDREEDHRGRAPAARRSHRRRRSSRSCSCSR
jgi:hypothetical protein